MACCRSLLFKQFSIFSSNNNNRLNFSRILLTKSVSVQPAAKFISNKCAMNHQPSTDASPEDKGDDDKIGNKTNMAKVLAPPPRKGMTTLDVTAFDKEVAVPTLTIPNNRVRHVVRQLKPFLLKVRDLPNLVPVGGTDKKKLLLDPDKVPDLQALFATQIPKLDPEVQSSAGVENVTLRYAEWSYREILDAILPDDQDKFSGYSATGHVVHVNLKEHLLPFKHIIGQVLLDKISFARTVVNKLEQIDSVFRNFQMDFLAGEHDTIVTLRENKCTFQFDFATVYWNSRLSTEHDRVVSMLQPHCVVFDVFAGVGPFAIPAAKQKKCRVLANDLNPESTKWLGKNTELNKVIDRVHVFNKDGREFLRDDVAEYLKSALKKSQLVEEEEDQEEAEHLPPQFHVIMNLPAIAPEFLPALWGLLHGADPLPSSLVVRVHVYCFVKDVSDYEDKALKLVKEQLGCDLSGTGDRVEVTTVRNVAPNKEMMRVSFNVPHHILTTTAAHIQQQLTTTDQKQELEPQESAMGSGVKRKLTDCDL